MTDWVERAQYRDIIEDIRAIERCAKMPFRASAERYLYAPKPLSADQWALDIGCGQGHGCIILADMGYHVDGIDRCRDFAAANTVARVHCAQASVGKWKPVRRYDLICACDVLEHLQRPEGILLHIKSWLAPGGLLYITVPIEGNRSPNPYHVKAWSRSEAIAMIEKHWNILAELRQTPRDNLYVICRSKTPHATL
jgi:2-polyprenyl-3-methyl-5-hydroxy-6-metoxy-1,4-benzoquinol methylase